jgi:hypothetical protein
MWPFNKIINGLKNRLHLGWELSWIALAFERTPALPRQKIIFGETGADGVRGLLIYCSGYKCRHRTAISGDRWPDDVPPSDLEPQFICQFAGSEAPMSGVYFSELLIEVYLVFKLEPRPLTTAMIASAMPAAINPYSMAVAPDWSCRKRENSLVIG